MRNVALGKVADNISGVFISKADPNLNPLFHGRM